MKNVLSFSFLLIVSGLITGCSIFHKTARKKALEGVDNSAISNANLENTHWKLVSIMGAPIATDNMKEPYIQLSSAEKRIVGTGGCNNFFGGYELKEHGRLKFSALGSTQMACPNMETEAALHKALETTDSYMISGDTLYLHKARMAPLAKFIVKK